MSEQTSGEELRGLLERLNERAAWLQKEYLNGGSFVHLRAREDECRYIADKLVSPAISALLARIEVLEGVAKGAAQVQLIDSELVGDKIVYRFTMPGEQFFNPPKFISDARAALSPKEG